MGKLVTVQVVQLYHVTHYMWQSWVMLFQIVFGD